MLLFHFYVTLHYTKLLCNVVPSSDDLHARNQVTQLVYPCYMSNFIVAHHLYRHDTKVHYTPTLYAYHMIKTLTMIPGEFIRFSRNEYYFYSHFKNVDSVFSIYRILCNSITNKMNDLMDIK